MVTGPRRPETGRAEILDNLLEDDVMKVQTFCVRHAPDARPNKWCGPAAISILTGLTAEEAAERIKKWRGHWGRDFLGRQRPVKGTTLTEIQAVLNRQGIRLVACSPRLRGLTQARALRLLADEEADVGDVFLIDAGWHWQVKERCRSRWVHTCSVTGPTDKPVFSRKRVSEVYRVTRV